MRAGLQTGTSLTMGEGEGTVGVREAGNVRYAEELGEYYSTDAAEHENDGYHHYGEDRGKRNYRGPWSHRY